MKDYVMFALCIIVPLGIVSVNKTGNKGSIYFYILLFVLLIKVLSHLLDWIFSKKRKSNSSEEEKAAL